MGKGTASYPDQPLSPGPPNPPAAPDTAASAVTQGYHCRDTASSVVRLLLQLVESAAVRPETLFGPLFVELTRLAQGLMRSRRPAGGRLPVRRPRTRIN